MHNFGPHDSIHRILVPKPVLPTTIHNAAVGTLNHIPAAREDEALVTQAMCPQ